MTTWGTCEGPVGTVWPENACWTPVTDCTPISGFTGDFALSERAATVHLAPVGFTDGNWSFAAPTGEVENYAMSRTGAAVLEIAYVPTTDTELGESGEFYAEITIPQDGVISFDWDACWKPYRDLTQPCASDLDSTADNVGYKVDGAQTILADSDTMDPPGASGSVSGLAVTAGQVLRFFSFRNILFGTATDVGPTLTITNFLLDCP